jgi:hypothetical protein
MKTLSSSQYGIFNEKLIKEKLPKTQNNILTGQVIEEENCVNNKYFLIEGKYEGESIDVIKKSVEIGCSGGENAGNFEYALSLKDGTQLENKEFNPELIFTDDESGGEVVNNEGNFFLKIEGIENADKLYIMKEGQLIKEIELSELTSQINAKPCKNE